MAGPRFRHAHLRHVTPAPLIAATCAHTSALYDVAGGSDGSRGGTCLCTGTTGCDGPSGLGVPNGTAAFTG